MEWFKTWFASPYYPILYKNRDEQEAELFLSKLIHQLQPAKDARFLDLACGAGRHAIYLNQQGFDVTGTDLSEPSIKTANQYANDQLNFYVQDMRQTFRTNYFDFILNLFTSFGYFEKETDNIKMLKAAKKGLKKDGTIVIDFMNAQKVVRQLIPEETKSIEHIDFHITKWTDDRFIYKRIQFEDHHKQQQDFTEKVQLINFEKFEYFCKKSGLKIIRSFGDYQLNSFDPHNSDRLILEIKKC